MLQNTSVCVGADTSMCVIYLCAYLCKEKKTGKQGTDALTAFVAGCSAWGKAYFLLCVRLDFSPKYLLYTGVYSTLEPETKSRLYLIIIIFFYLGGPEKQTRVVSHTSASTEDLLRTCYTGVPGQDTQGKAMGWAAEGPGISVSIRTVPRHSITHSPLDHKRWSYLGHFAETKQEK